MFFMIWLISNLAEVCVKKSLSFYMFNHNFLLMTLISKWYSFLRKLTFNSVTYYLQYPLTQTLFYIVPSPCQVSIFTISKYQCSNSNYLHNIHIYLFVFLGFRVSLIFEIKHVSYSFGYEMCFINAGKQKGHRTSERVDINNQGDN